MKFSPSKFSVLVMLLPLILTVGCERRTTRQTTKPVFSFAFLTDIHIQPEDNAVEGFSKVLDTLNILNPDFIVTGGDLVMDAFATTYERADSLYNIYLETLKKSNAKIYNTIGNHEIYGWHAGSKADPNHPEYGEKMFEKRIGKSYYSFEHKGWKFMILNSIEPANKGKYIGLIDLPQLEWVKQELTSTSKNTPIVLVTHIPLITIYKQRYSGSTLPNDSSLVVSNSKDLLDLFRGYNLKLVLQGHLHTVENIYVDGIHFITGGAVSGGWWRGPNMGYEEGFVWVDVYNDSIAWRYVDYGWQAKPSQSSK